MKFKLTVDFLKLQVGEANKLPKFDMVHVIRLPSFEGWLRTKVALLQRERVLVWPGYIPKHCLYIVVHCDSGQGSTKLGVRILNVPHCRSPTNLDPLCVFEEMETYSNIVVCAKELFKQMEKLHLKWVTINYQFYFLVFFLSSDWKMVSTLHGHSGASSTFFNALDYSVLNDLVPGRIPGGPVLGKYQSVSPFQFVDGRVGAMHPKYREIVGWIWAGTRQRHEIVEDAANYADLERERVHLIEMLIVRAASFSGFFACNFPNEKPTPKLYLALTHGIQFIMHHKFCGYADEEPMESQHADHNRIRVRSRHCVNQQVAMLHGVNTLLVRNNVNCCITAGKLRDELGEVE